VLELLTSLAEKSLLVTAGDGAPRYRMLTTIKEYAADRLAEAGESELARQAHLAYFVELTETAEPHLRRAEQLHWLAVLEADHDNLSAALRGAIAADEPESAMRLAAAAGWYWFLGGRRTEGLELLIAAADLPGEVSPDVRAMTYGMVVLYVTSGHGDESLGAEWIHKAYQLGQLGESTNPLLEFAIPLERLLQGPDQAMSAFEPLQNSPDPWVRAISRWQSAKMRIIFGPGDPAEDLRPELEQALAQFRALGERFGMYLVLSELAGYLAQRGDLAGACQYFEQAATVLAELGAVEDVIEVRTQQAVLYWLDGDRDASAAAIAAAERSAEGVTWPYALVSLALAKAELARLGGDPAEARRQLDLATALLGEIAELPNLRAAFHTLRGYLTDDLEESRRHRVAAVEAAAQVGAATVTARIVVGVADLAVRLGAYDQATRLLAASIVVRGVPDHSHPDAARIEQEARRHLGDDRFAEVTREGAQTSWSDLVEVTLNS
jgi:tetratricopeptide (TPR) repeat protein